MNCSVWEERIALYQGGDLPSGQVQEVERHLGECAGCQVFASGLKETLEVLREAHGDLPAGCPFHGGACAGVGGSDQEPGGLCGGGCSPGARSRRSCW